MPKVCYDIWAPPTLISTLFVCFNYPVQPSQDQKRIYQDWIKYTGFVLPCRHCRKLWDRLSRDMAKFTTDRDTFAEKVYKIVFAIDSSHNATIVNNFFMSSYQRCRNTMESMRASCVRVSEPGIGCKFPQYGISLRSRINTTTSRNTMLTPNDHKPNKPNKPNKANKANKANKRHMCPLLLDCQINSEYTPEELNSSQGFQTNVWGPILWRMLHTIAYTYPDQPKKIEKENYQQWLWRTGQVLPCGFCRSNFDDRMREAGWGEWALHTNIAFFNFLVKLHNAVNRHKGEYSANLQEIREEYDKITENCIVSIVVSANQEQM